jgi:hypothetical protein
LDKFKAVGDVLANIDPSHIGLALGGDPGNPRGIHSSEIYIISCGLTVRRKGALSDSNQRAILVTGIELALYTSNRFKVYLPAID